MSKEFPTNAEMNKDVKGLDKWKRFLHLREIVSSKYPKLRPIYRNRACYGFILEEHATGLIRSDDLIVLDSPELKMNPKPKAVSKKSSVLLDPTELKPLPFVSAKEFGLITERADQRYAIELASLYLNMDDVTPELLLGRANNNATALEAWNTLYDARRTKKGGEDFRSKLKPKIVPTQSQLEKQDVLEDDGRKTISIIRRIQKDRQESAVCGSAERP